MWELDYKESWVLKNWCFWTVVLEKSLKSPLDCKEFQTVHQKWDQSWVFIGRIDVLAETPILWPPDVKSWLLEKTLMLGKIEGRRRKGWTGIDGWMGSLTQSTWVWVDSGSWWWTGRPGVLLFMGSQRVRHDWVTELNWLKKMWRAYKESAVIQEPQETQVQSLDEDMTIHSSILTWRIPMDRGLGGLQSIGSQSVRHNWTDLARTNHNW